MPADEEEIEDALAEGVLLRELVSPTRVILGEGRVVALECIRCGNCESGRGCPRGIATTDTELAHMYGYDWGAQRIINLYRSWSMQTRGIL